MKLYEVLRYAKKNDEKCTLALVDTFTPLINKYGRKISDDGKSEITFFLIKLIKKIPDFESDDKIVSYIHMSIKNHCYQLIKNQSMEYPTEAEVLYNMEISENEYSNVEIISLIRSLPPLQKKVIYGVYFLGYSETYIAEKLAVTRQAINNAKKRALDKLKNYLTNE